MRDLFNEDYYENGVQLGISGYTNYHWMPKLTIPMCEKIIEYLCIKKNEKILDFGCAKGFIVKAFRDLGYDCYGTDISDYAISQAPDEIKSRLCLLDNLNLEQQFQTIIAKDVFEHIEPEILSGILQKLRPACDKLFCVVPLGDGKKYIIPEYENDITHIIREDREWWINFFEENEMKVQYFSYLMDGIKDNWSHYPKGNGCFILS